MFQKMHESYYFKIFKYIKYAKRDILFLILITAIRVILNFPLPDAIQRFFDNMSSGNEGGFLTDIGLIVFLIVAGLLSGYIGSLRTQKIGYHLTLMIRSTLLKKVLSLPYKKLSALRTGDVVSRITGDSAVFKEYIMSVVIEPIISVILIVVYVIILMRLNLLLALITLCSLPILSLVIKFYHKKTTDASFAYRDNYGILYNKLIELFNSMKLIKAMHFEERHERQMNVYFNDVKDTGLKVERLSIRSTFFSSLITNIGQLCVLIIGGYLTGKGEMTFAQFISFYMFLQLAYAPIQSVTIAFASYQKGLGMLKRVFDILDTSSDEEANAGTIPVPDGDISVSGVDFAYTPDKKILNDFSCTFKANALNVVIGHSGVGKTTLMDLLLRLYAPEAGNIQIGGIDLKELASVSFTDKIGVFTQETVIFDGTIAENIAYYKPNSTHEEIVAAAEKAHIKDYIQTLENGYDTLTGERGNKLSGGERARIALARIFLKEPEIIFMDEPTSNIDPQTEQVIYDSLKILKEKSTIIMIAHKESAMAIADNVIDMNQTS
ncbi:MAG TPA: ABC transporter ATP-binding protein [Thermotogota bacterium]|nr:ABC transporter ATP-binding protein [Thermotogota bacterium]